MDKCIQTKQGLASGFCGFAAGFVSLPGVSTLANALYSMVTGEQLLIGGYSENLWQSDFETLDVN
ncbi:MAG: hypothetical protein KTR32_24500 [Granulosicoccus sp.]|nr:hypothetical protein [Granulosicoccus sp.]